MNRRQLISTLAVAPVAAQQMKQSSAPLRFRSGLVAYSYRKELAAKSMSYDDVIHKIAEWGLDGLDCTVYWFPDTSPEFLAGLRRTAFKNGVQIYNAGVRVQLSQPTPEMQRAELENIQKWVDVAERLGAGHVRVFGGNVPKGATEEQAIAWAAEVLKRGAEYSGRKGIILGVENDYGLTIAAGPTVEIVKRADSPWAGVNADSGNLRTDGYAQFATLLPYVTSVHLKREMTTPDGKKEPADWTRLLQMLGRAGYKGYVGLEYEAENTNDIPKLAVELRNVVRKLSA